MSMPGPCSASPTIVPQADLDARLQRQPAAEHVGARACQRRAHAAGRGLGRRFPARSPEPVARPPVARELYVAPDVLVFHHAPALQRRCRPRPSRDRLERARPLLSLGVGRVVLSPPEFSASPMQAVPRGSRSAARPCSQSFRFACAMLIS